MNQFESKWTINKLSIAHFSKHTIIGQRWRLSDYLGMKNIVEPYFGINLRGRSLSD